MLPAAVTDQRWLAENSVAEVVAADVVVVVAVEVAAAAAAVGAAAGAVVNEPAIVETAAVVAAVKETVAAAGAAAAGGGAAAAGVAAAGDANAGDAGVLGIVAASALAPDAVICRPVKTEVASSYRRIAVLPSYMTKTDVAAVVAVVANQLLVVKIALDPLNA